MNEKVMRVEVSQPYKASGDEENFFYKDPSSLNDEELLGAYKFGQENQASTIEGRETVKTQVPHVKDFGQDLIENAFTRLNLLGKEIENRGLKTQTMEERGL